MQLKGIRRNTYKRRWPLFVGEEDAKQAHVIGLFGNYNWQLKFYLINTNREITYRKILRCKNKNQIRNLSRNLDTVMCKWLNKTKEI